MRLQVYDELEMDLDDFGANRYIVTNTPYEFSIRRIDPRLDIYGVNN